MEHLTALSNLPQELRDLYISFLQNALAQCPQSSQQATELLRSIPVIAASSEIPITCLSDILAAHRIQWPTFELIRCHTRLWQLLPDDCKDVDAPPDPALPFVKGSYQGLLDFFHKDSEAPALIDPQTFKHITHRKLYQFVANFRLPIRRVTEKKSLVVIALPNGALLGLASLAITTWYTAVPVNASSGPDQFRIDVQQSESKVILVLQSDVTKLGLDATWVKEAGIEVLVVDQKPDLTFSVTHLDGLTNFVSQPPTLNGPDDSAFILFTSGTSGTKKMVPVTTHSVASGVAFVGESWGLTEKESCLNQMPLNHVGGLVRNLFAPIFHGGSTICCTGFDANQFWDIVEESHPTWYYASPTMHSAILEAGADRTEAQAKLKIRLVCNAAGGLLPSLAVRLRDLFHCTVLPSYGMTECMPISTPLLDYTLDRPGTSGISCGPEMAILDGNNQPLPPNEIGMICVRGSPLFPGYLTKNGLDKSAFKKAGWFDTGDMGYMDEDKYLYVTGRSKEVINRGGELISPFEVEEAIVTAARDPKSSIYGRVSEALAFSAPHEVLQEVVGAVIVTPEGQPRIDLRLLQAAVKSSLHSTKWPVTLVFMDAVPKNATNKVLRIKLGERYSYPNLTDDVTMAELHFEADCPPHNSPLTLKIPKQEVYIDEDAVVQAIQHFTADAFDVFSTTNEKNGLIDVVLAPRFSIGTDDLDVQELRSRLQASIDGYLVPTNIKKIDTPFPLTSEGIIDMAELNALLRPAGNASTSGSSSPVELKIREIFATLLSCTVAELGADTDFFEAGGDSMKAGRLLSMLRKEFDVRISIGELFTNSTVSALRQKVERDAPSKAEKEVRESIPLPGCTKTYSSTNPLLLIIQALPLTIIYPMKRALEWTVLLYMLSISTIYWPNQVSAADRFVTLLFSIFIARMVTQIVPPLLAILCKWIIIGRHKQGMYPMWGSYHTRWWLAEKIIAIGGKGIFKQSNFLRVTYYRLLGARIGKGVTIDNGAVLGEYDLLEIGDRSCLDRCLCRPFGVERNTSMYLGAIKIGKNCSVGLKSTIAPGAVLPDNTCIGPNSSSWEQTDATEANRDLSQSKAAQPHWVLKALVAFPVHFFIKIIALGPWMVGLLGLVMQEPLPSDDELRSIVLWFSTPTRVGFHFLARLLNVLFGPLVFIFLVIGAKQLLDKNCGKLRPGPPEARSGFEKFRLYLYRSLLSGSELAEVRGNFGSHYETTSVLVRLLGGKVGQRVYWPGSGPSIQDYDFIDIGSNVVFGSRAALVTSDSTGSNFVRVGDGAMVADRAVLLPGSSLGKKTVFGSGALARRDMHYPAGTVWVGNQGGGAVNLTTGGRGATATLRSTAPSGTATPIGSVHKKHLSTVYGFDLEAARIAFNKELETSTDRKFHFADSMEMSAVDRKQFSVCVSEKMFDRSSFVSEKKSPESESTPFGRAFYEGKANYHVLGLFSIALYSTWTTVFTSIYWNIPTVISVQAVAFLYRNDVDLISNKRATRPLIMYAVIAGMIALVLTFQALLATGFVIASKWILMGRRMPGSYDWDKSSYCQRWQIYLTLERLRRNCYGGHGILGMLTGTHFAVMYMRALGANIGKDCALFAGGKPSLLFTEPDLLTLGDRVCVDDASLVGHINSRGNFNLNPLTVGNRSVLRSGSRLLSGAHMGEDSCLLEHTLIMAGDIAESGTTYQGWPGEAFDGHRV